MTPDDGWTKDQVVAFLKLARIALFPDTVPPPPPPAEPLPPRLTVFRAAGPATAEGGRS
jgi:hypothetical protein